MYGIVRSNEQENKMKLVISIPFNVDNLIHYDLDSKRRFHSQENELMNDFLWYNDYVDAIIMRQMPSVNVIKRLTIKQSYNFIE